MLNSDLPLAIGSNFRLNSPPDWQSDKNASAQASGGYDMRVLVIEDDVEADG